MPTIQQLVRFQRKQINKKTNNKKKKSYDFFSR